MYIYQELVKIHHGFNHPTYDKLFNVLKLARTWEMNQKFLEVLDLISKLCNPS